MQNALSTRRTHDAETIAASGNNVSSVIDLRSYARAGFFSVRVQLSGDGTGRIQYQLSYDNSTFYTPTSASDIDTAHTKSDGPNSDGDDIFAFSPEIAPYMKIIITETGGVNSITVTIDLCIQ